MQREQKAIRLTAEMLEHFKQEADDIARRRAKRVILPYIALIESSVAGTLLAILVVSIFFK